LIYPQQQRRRQKQCTIIVQSSAAQRGAQPEQNDEAEPASQPTN
jgi:hypothetical protein